MLNITGNKLLKFCGNLLWLLCGSLLVLNCTFCVRHIKRSKMKLIRFCFVLYGYGSSHCQVGWHGLPCSLLCCLNHCLKYLNLFLRNVYCSGSKASNEGLRIFHNHREGPAKILKASH